MYDIFVHYINMDVCVKEQVVKNTDDSFSIFINARRSYETQVQAYVHAMKHICNGDFDEQCADNIELSAHAL